MPTAGYIDSGTGLAGHRALQLHSGQRCHSCPLVLGSPGRSRDINVYVSCEPHRVRGKGCSMAISALTSRELPWGRAEAEAKKNTIDPASHSQTSPGCLRQVGGVILLANEATIFLPPC